MKSGIHFVGRKGRGAGGFSATTGGVLTAFFEKVEKVSEKEITKSLVGLGRAGRRVLREKYLRGQEIMLTKDVSSKGRQTVMYKVTKSWKAITLYWSAYPLNFFERGRVLRNGTFERGKRVFSAKFPKDAQALIPRYMRLAEKMIAQGVEK